MTKSPQTRNDVPVRMIMVAAPRFRRLVGSEAVVIRLSRVPIVGERILFRDQDYEVREVTHTPEKEDRAAEIIVANSQELRFQNYEVREVRASAKATGEQRDSRQRRPLM